MKADHFLFILFLPLILLSASACSQTQTKDNAVLNKTFKTVVGSVCMETDKPMPCAGYTVYLELSFKDDFVLVNEKGENDCGTVSEDKYKTNYSIKGNIVKVDKLTRYGEPLKIDQLLFAKNSLVGKTTDTDGSETEYIFEELKTK